MKDLLVSLSSNFTFQDLKPWILSFSKVNSSAKRMILLYNCDAESVKKIKDFDFEILSPAPQNADGSYGYTNNQIHMNVERFGHMWAFLRKRKDEFRYILSTDSRDVVFQKDPFEFIHEIFSKNIDKNYILSSEGIVYKDEQRWGAPNFYHSFGPSAFDHIQDKIIYNCGTLAGRSENIIDLFCFIFFMSVNNAVPNPDQAAYNFILSQEPFKSTAFLTDHDTGWAAQLGTMMANNFDNAIKENKPIWKNNKFITKQNKEFYIIHQYDRINEIKKYYEEIYK
ncbi:MAG: hypothetical protein EBR82_40950 [Caulobacteraceae bacterium]|nr:hypothetical protein [Caulobacteraceae bacterium]